MHARYNLNTSKRLNIFIKSYLFIMLIPILLGIFLVVLSSRNLKQEIYNVNYAGLVQAKNAVEARLKVIDSVIAMYQFDKRLLNLLQYDDGSVDFILQRNRFNDTLNSSVVSDSIIKDFFIYSVKNRYILSRTYSADFNYFANVKLKSYNIFIDDLHAFLCRYWNRHFEILSINGDDTGLICVSSIPYNSARAVMGAFFFVVDTDELARTLGLSNWNKAGNLLLLDSADTIIASSLEDHALLNYDFSQIDHSLRSYSFSFRGDKHIVSSISGEIGGFTYISVIPESVFLKKSILLTRVAALSLLSCLLVEVMLVYYFTLINYKPLSNAVSQIKTKTGDKSKNDADEYAFILSSISHTFDENSRLKSMLDHNREYVRQYMLYRLLKNDTSVAPIHLCDLREYDIDFKHRYYVAVLITVDDFGIFLSESSSSNMESTDKKVLFAIQDKLKDIFNRFVFYTVGDGSTLTIIINPERDDIRFEEFFLEIYESLFQTYRLTVSICISGTFSRLTDISVAYEQAIELYRNVHISDDQHVFSYDNHADISSSELSELFTFVKRKQIINQMLCGDYQNARKIIAGYLENNNGRNDPTFFTVKHAAYTIISIFHEVVNELNISSTLSASQYYQYMYNISQCQKFMDVLDVSMKIITTLEAVFKKENGEDTSVLIADIQKHIDDNFSDSQLSVAAISERFGMGQSYISRVFKQKKRVGMLEYINKKRIQESKVLLTTTSKTISEISECVGFISANTYIRVFKRYEGITPGRYKEIKKD